MADKAGTGWEKMKGSGRIRKAKTRDGYATLSKGDTKGLLAKFEKFASLQDAVAPSPSPSSPSSPSPSSALIAAATKKEEQSSNGASTDAARLLALSTLLETQPAKRASLVEVDQALSVILFHLQNVVVVPGADNDTGDNESGDILVHDDDAWKIKSVEGGLQVYEFLGFREEPDQPNLLLCLRDRNRLTAELLALTVTKLQELQQYFSETLGCLPYLDLQLGGKREKAPASSPSLRFPTAVAEMKGRRRTMEDYVMVWGNFRGRGEEDYFSLFDGHGGSDASLFACENLHFQIWKHMNQKRIADNADPANNTEDIKKILTAAFLETHDLMRRNKELNGKKIKGGTTVVTALIINSLLYVAHVGDSRAVLYAIEEREESWKRRTATNEGVARGALIGRRNAESLAPIGTDNNDGDGDGGEGKGSDEGEEDSGEESREVALQPKTRKVIAARTMALTTDHKPNDEREKKRIEELGGLVIYSKMDGVPRLNGTIAVSRSLGDLHDPNVDGYMSQEPDINVVDLAEVGQSSEAKTVKSLILVLACDGLWDKLSNEEVGEIVKTQVCAEADLYHMAETLMKTSYDKGSTDNISVMVVDLSSSLSPALN